MYSIVARSISSAVVAVVVAAVEGTAAAVKSAEVDVAATAEGPGLSMAVLDCSLDCYDKSMRIILSE